MKNIIKIVTFLFLVLIAFSCSNSDDNPSSTPGYTTTTFNATLSGVNETPPNSSTATGTAVLIYNSSTKKFTVTVNHTVSSPTGAHIHLVSDGKIVFGFPNATSPIVYTSPALNATQEADLMANHYYVNVHSAAPYTAGEISGVLVKGTSTTIGGGGGGGGYNGGY